MMTEIYKTIDDYPNYEVSNLGNVRNRLTGKVLRPDRSKRGYLRIDLRKYGKKKKFLIHRLVANAFIPNPENKRTVNHINGCKTDNYISNLEWNTDSENQKHAHRIGLKEITNNHISNRIKQKVRCIETGQVFESQHDAARYFGCTQGSIPNSINKGGKVLKKYHFELV